MLSIIIVHVLNHLTLFKYKNNILKYYQTMVKHLMLCTTWYHLHNLKIVRNSHGGVLLSVSVHGLACNFNKSNTRSWVFFPFIKLHKWYQIVQNISYYYYYKKINICSQIYATLDCSASANRSMSHPIWFKTC